MKREAIEYFKFYRKIFCEEHLKICPKDSIAYQATLKEKEFYDMAIKALEQEPTTRNCFGCKHSKDNHNAGTEECHLCMWQNQYTPATKKDLPHFQHTDEEDEETTKSFIEDVEAVKDLLPCFCEQMDFPNTFDEFAKDYGFKDKDEIYTNGSELIPVFRVKQWLEHISTTKNNLGVECIDKWDIEGKEAELWIVKGKLQVRYIGTIHNIDMSSVTLQEPRWIPVSERLPEAEYGESDSVLVCFENETQDILYFNGSNWCYPTGEIYISVNHKNGWHNKVIAWMPLPQAYSEVEE